MTSRYGSPKHDIQDTDPQGRDIQAFIMIPSGHNGADKDLVAKLSGTGSSEYTTQVSHYLMDTEYDVITRRLLNCTAEVVE